jgi:hypothetical protein
MKAVEEIPPVEIRKTTAHPGHLTPLPGASGVAACMRWPQDGQVRIVAGMEHLYHRSRCER